METFELKKKSRITLHTKGSEMTKRNIYIKAETETRLAALGGSGRSENLRRAVALAEVAGELAESMKPIFNAATPDEVFDALEGCQQALDKYREISHE